MTHFSAKVSLIIPAFNREQFVSAAVGSILRQTYRDFELVVWDDGSADGTADAAEAAASADPRVRIVRGQHGGVSASINAAAKILGGKYFAWVDSDDALMPTALAETVAVLDSMPEVGMVYTDYVTMDETGQLQGIGKRCSIPYSRDRLLIDFMTFHFRLMRRELFDAVGGADPAMDGAEDYDLSLKLSEITNIHHLARPLYLYRVHSSSVSAQRRLQQIMTSKEAVTRALQRRNMDREYEIDVELIGRFKLKKKKSD
jgi:glycosyltransferase involved in cell wall biosynthesis